MDRAKEDRDQVERDLLRLQEENWKLRQQLELMRQTQNRARTSNYDSKYEELMDEILRLKGAFLKVRALTKM